MGERQLARRSANLPATCHLERLRPASWSGYTSSHSPKGAGPGRARCHGFNTARALTGHGITLQLCMNASVCLLRGSIRITASTSSSFVAVGTWKDPAVRPSPRRIQPLSSQPVNGRYRREPTFIPCLLAPWAAKGRYSPDTAPSPGDRLNGRY